MNRATSKYFKVGATAKIDEKCFGKLFIYFFLLIFFYPIFYNLFFVFYPKSLYILSIYMLLIRHLRRIAHVIY